MAKRRLETNAPSGQRAWLDRAVSGALRVLDHELGAMSGHWSEVQERIAVARASQGFRGLVAAQVDLLPETRARLALDQRERRALLHSWVTDLRGRRAAA